VLAEIDRFVRDREVRSQRASKRVAASRAAQRKARHAEYLNALREVVEAKRLHARVARIVEDIEQRLRIAETEARVAIAEAFADYRMRVARKRT